MSFPQMRVVFYAVAVSVVSVTTLYHIASVQSVFARPRLVHRVKTLTAILLIRVLVLVQRWTSMVMLLEPQTVVTQICTVMLGCVPMQSAQQVSYVLTIILLVQKKPFTLRGTHQMLNVSLKIVMKMPI